MSGLDHDAMQKLIGYVSYRTTLLKRLGEQQEDVEQTKADIVEYDRLVADYERRVRESARDD